MENCLQEEHQNEFKEIKKFDNIKIYYKFVGLIETERVVSMTYEK